jgi:hypothetical protein
LIVIAIANLPTDFPALTQLFRAYAASLPIDLGYQGFDDELASLPGKYAPPEGALLIARDAEGAALGCVAMRPLEPGVCEMKRLSVALEGRGSSKRPARRAIPKCASIRWPAWAKRRRFIAASASPESAPITTPRSSTQCS